jgi:hypothetical protein
MGMICEFYRVTDKVISELKTYTEDELSEYLNENYASVYGKYHRENDVVFCLDKAWDVSRFLIVMNDTSENKILQNIYGNPINENFYSMYNYLLSDEILKINKTLQNIEIDDLYNSYDEEKMIEPNIYRATGFSWTFIKQHIETIMAAFKRSAELNEGLIINIG